MGVICVLIFLIVFGVVIILDVVNIIRTLAFILWLVRSVLGVLLSILLLDFCPIEVVRISGLVIIRIAKKLTLTIKGFAKA